MNGLDLHLMYYVTHNFVELLPFKLVFHLSDSILGAAVSFLGWHQPIVVPVFLCPCEHMVPQKDYW